MIVSYLDQWRQRLERVVPLFKELDRNRPRQRQLHLFRDLVLFLVHVIWFDATRGLIVQVDVATVTHGRAAFKLAVDDRFECTADVVEVVVDAIRCCSTQHSGDIVRLLSANHYNTKMRSNEYFGMKRRPHVPCS